MPERLSSKEGGDKLKLYSQNEFLLNLKDFLLIFKEENDSFISVREFLQDYHNSGFLEIQGKLKGGNAFNLVQNSEVLYHMYLSLRNEGEFSNQDLGLKC